MPIEFSAESKKRIYESLHNYFQDQFDEDIGLLRTGKLFDFVVNLIGASIYNQAITDAQAWLQGKLLDLQGDLHQQVELAP
jgi:uncharacterized protein (DUF2164 family)